MRKVSHGLALILDALSLVAGAQAQTPDCSAMAKAVGQPTLSDGQAHVVLCRTGHLLAHSDERKTPIWDVEHLTRERFDGAARQDKLCRFRADPELESEGRPFATDADYEGKSKQEKQVFDRGHVAPAADLKWDGDAMRESCFLSNIAPQQGLNLNRHVWANLEGLVRDWTCDRTELYAITGPIYDDASPDTLGDGVAVPSAFYKTEHEPRLKRAIAFILPNTPVPKAGGQAADVLQDFIVKPSEVEQRAGIRLFGALTTRDRNRVLANKAAMWRVVDSCGAG